MSGKENAVTEDGGRFSCRLGAQHTTRVLSVFEQRDIEREWNIQGARWLVVPRPVRRKLPRLAVVRHFLGGEIAKALNEGSLDLAEVNLRVQSWEESSGEARAAQEV